MALNLNVTEVFDRNYHSRKRININRGGTRSGKTYALCQIACLWLLTGRINPNEKPQTSGIFSVVRKTLPSLKATALRDVIEILTDWGAFDDIGYNKTDREMTYSGRMLEFFSVDDQQKVRSRKRDHLLIIEANEIDYQNTFKQLLFRTSGKIFMDFNPDDPDVWINTELEMKRAHRKNDVEVIVSNYTMNPFLPADLVAEIEYLKEVDKMGWQVFGLGEYGKMEGLYYPDFEVIDKMPEFDDRFGGLDFGYVHPTALVRMQVNERDLYVDQLFYKSGVTPDQLARDEFPRLSVAPTDLIYADSAKPGDIQQLYNAGYRGVKPAQKGQGSVASGIKKVQSYRIHITARSVDVIKEIRKYRRKQDKDGNFIDEPVKIFDDAMDAMRYGVYTHTYKAAAIHKTRIIELFRPPPRSRYSQEAHSRERFQEVGQERRGRR